MQVHRGRAHAPTGTKASEKKTTGAASNPLPSCTDALSTSSSAFPSLATRPWICQTTPPPNVLPPRRHPHPRPLPLHLRPLPLLPLQPHTRRLPPPRPRVASRMRREGIGMWAGKESKESRGVVEVPVTRVLQRNSWKRRTRSCTRGGGGKRQGRRERWRGAGADAEIGVSQCK